jgi:LmbE family N-acetylglucosaminyl deacetylase
MVIAPHPDDEVLGCGGTIARHAGAGDEVHVVVVTRGAPEVFPAGQVEQVRQEAARAHEVLGVAATHYLDLPAPMLDTVPKYRQAGAIRSVIGDVRPEVVYLPHHGDIHHDHRETYMAVLVAARPLSDCSVRRLLCYETLSETEWAPPIADNQFCPNVFINIEPHLQKKLEAMSCFTSQLRPSPSSRSLQTIEALARLRGATVHLAAAEAFQLVRDITH